MGLVEVVFYLDVLSSWCHVADRALEHIERKYGDDVHVDWRIAQLFDFGPIPYRIADYPWYYERTRRISGVELNPAWFDSPDARTVHANAAAEALRSLGFAGPEMRRGLSRAAVVDGKRMGQRDVALAEAARLSGVPAAEVERAMESEAVRERIRATTAEFQALHLPQLPSFLITNAIDDRAALSGLYTFASLDAVIGEMLHAARVTEEVGPLV